MALKWDGLSPELKKKLAEQNPELVSWQQPEVEPPKPFDIKRHQELMRRFHRMTMYRIKVGRFTSGE